MEVIVAEAELIPGYCGFLPNRATSEKLGPSQLKPVISNKQHISVATTSVHR